MTKDNTIYTCYGCPYYYVDKGDRYAKKHCGRDHLECPWYLDKEEK